MLPTTWDEGHLQRLISDEVPESLSLEYKASAALDKGDKQKNELSKDISAFANSAGGKLIYGIREDAKRHVPTGVDEGVDRTKITNEWLENVIRAKINPAIDHLLIHQVPLLSNGLDKVSYVIDIAQATSRAPHQASDHKYYKRFNFEAVPMEDYEVRDLRGHFGIRAECLPRGVGWSGQM